MAFWGEPPRLLWAATPLILEQSKEHYPLGHYLEILEDPEGSLTIEQVASATFREKFQQSQTEIPNLGVTPSVYWVTFQIQSQRQALEKWILEIDYAVIESLTFYIQNEEGRFQAKQTGMFHNPSRGDINYRTFLFEVLTNPTQTHTFYLRFKVFGSMQFPLTLSSPLKFAQKAYHEQYAFGLFYGIMLVMCFYNLFIFFAVRDSSYLYYVGYLITSSIHAASYSGLFYLIVPQFPQFWLNFFISSVGLSAVFVSQFSRKFLNTQQKFPALDRILVLFIGVWGCMSVVSLFHYSQFLFSILGALTLIFLPLMIYMGIHAIRHGFKPARFFILSWLPFTLGTVFFTLKTLGVLPVTVLTEYGPQIGSCLEAVLISLALADRINLIKREREQALKAQLQESQKVKVLKETFQLFVPHEFIQLLDKPSILEVKRGDQVEKEMSVLFSDIRGFSTLSETMTPKENFDFINAYLNRMEPAIKKYHGFIDKYIGDAIMALFDRQADDAVNAALSMLQSLAEYNATRQSKGFAPISIGIGINTGSLMLGIIGGENRMDGTVISDAVNLASRLENLTKLYGSALLISSSTFLKLKHPNQYRIRLIDRVKVKGKNDPVTVFEVFNGDPSPLFETKQQTLKTFEEGISLYHLMRFEEALARFQEVVEKSPLDLAAQVYLERCQQFLRSGLPEGWSGVTRLD